MGAGRRGQESGDAEELHFELLGPEKSFEFNKMINPGYENRRSLESSTPPAAPGSGPSYIAFRFLPVSRTPRSGEAHIPATLTTSRRLPSKENPPPRQ